MFPCLRATFLWFTNSLHGVILKQEVVKTVLSKKKKQVQYISYFVKKFMLGSMEQRLERKVASQVAQIYETYVTKLISSIDYMTTMFSVLFIVHAKSTVLSRM